LSRRTAVTGQLVAFATANFLGFLAVGIPLPALSIFVNKLGFSPFVVGVTIGAQAFATLITRQYAGRRSDAGHPKRAALLGFVCASATGIVYLLAQLARSQPEVSLALLIAGRALLGLGESLFVTALVIWSIARVGSQNSARAMAWSGISMYAALAFGAPVGLLMQHLGGFGLVAACTVVSPVLAAAMIFNWQDVASTGKRATLSIFHVLRKIWAPGFAMALASSGVGTISAFLTLRYQLEGWGGAAFALTSFGAAYVVMRLLFAGLPDRLGGRQTGAVSLLVEAIGLMLIWHSNSPASTLVGAVLSGIGYSLVFPSMGVEAMKRVPSESRGLVLGTFFACFDLGLALAGPGFGLVASTWGIPSAFLSASLAALMGLGILLLNFVPNARAHQ
jgi:MFS family permease